MMYGFRGGDFFLMPLMFLFMLSAFAFTVFLIYWLVKKGSSKQFSAGGEKEHSGQAMAIIRERYARGEITQEQYQEMKKNLE